MKTFFDTSVGTSNEVFESVRSASEAMGGEVAFDWIERGNTWQQEDLSEEDRKQIFSRAMNDILRSDIAIFDLGIPSMRIGYEVSFAIQHSKPTLGIAHKNQRDLATLFLRGSGSGFLTLKNYETPEELYELVNQFMKRYEGGKKHRLNLALEQYFAEYLEWKQFNEGTTKTQIIKDALHDIISKDANYKKIR